MKNGLVIADSGAIFSLAVIGKLELLEILFDSVKIPFAVWQEITLDKTNEIYNDINSLFKDKVIHISINLLNSILSNHDESTI